MARRIPPSFDFFPEDFLVGTWDMEPVAVGMYIRLLCYQWSHGKIKNQRVSVIRITGASDDEYEANWESAVLPKFIEEDGYLFNHRLDTARDAAIERQRTYVENGKKGGRPKKTKRFPSEKPSENQTLSPGETKTKPTGEMGDGRRKKEEGREKKVPVNFFGEAVPSEIDTDEFRATWADWCRHRSEIGKALTMTSVRQQLREFAHIGVERTVAAIRYTIGKGWQGIREPPTEAVSKAEIGRKLKI